jgi:hypothetical protein
VRHIKQPALCGLFYVAYPAAVEHVVRQPRSGADARRAPRRGEDFGSAEIRVNHAGYLLHGLTRGRGEDFGLAEIRIKAA